MTPTSIRSCTRSATAVAILSLLAACGDSGTAGDSAGRGTGTLVVEGNVTAENVVDNASTGAYFNTDFSVRVQRGGLDVTDAMVAIDSSGGPITLVYNAGNNRYQGSQSGYFRTYTLDVTAGADNLLGVRVKGPDIHTITAPIGNDAIDASLGVDLTWARSVVADACRVETSRDTFDLQDTGAFMIPFASISCDQTAVTEETVSVRREHRVLPDGATGTSWFTVRIRNEHTFLVLPNLGC